MNTRLQVEHPVTELVTGRDLVADQIRIASGEPLGLPEEAARASGHAVEVRLYAEDADAGFLPATGRIEALRWPVGDGIRVDAGIAHGDDVGGRFDPMLAKIVAWGPDRPAAFERLTRALDDALVLGLVTNLRFLRWLVREPVVLAGEARTDTLDRIWPPDDWAARRIPEAAGCRGDPDRRTPAADRPNGTGRAGGSVGGRLASPPSIRIGSRRGAHGRGVARVGGDSEGAAPASMAFVRVGDTVHVDRRPERRVPARPRPDVDAAEPSRRASWRGRRPHVTAELVSPMPGASWPSTWCGPGGRRGRPDRHP
jgi:acetyl-CoA/propionyl-CoA carboxylase biotin carboxyl carrier protein